MKKKIGVLIPVYNNSKSLNKTFEELMLLNIDKYELEVVFVNDGSKDDSQIIINHLAAAHENVKYIQFQRNFGQVAAIEAGLKHTNSEATIVISADLQDPVNLIYKMIEKWEAGAELVIAYRENREDGVLNTLLSKWFYKIIKYSLPDMPIGGYDYCLMDNKVVEMLNQMTYKNRFLQGDVLYGGFELALIPYTRSKGINNNKSFGLKKLSFKTKYFIDGILHSSVFPIRLISFLGIITTLLGIVYSIIIVIEWSQGKTPFVGWAPIMISIFFIGGIILLTLGVLGEYIWRIYDEMKKMPKYIIKDKNLKQ